MKWGRDEIIPRFHSRRQDGSLAAQKGRGQVSLEIVATAGVMLMLLFTMLLVNQHLQGIWDVQKQQLEASAAANQLAIAINRAAAGGNSTRLLFSNEVGPDITNISIYDGKAVRAYFSQGGVYSVAIVSSDVNVSGNVPLDQEIAVQNSNGTISVQAIG